MRTPILVLASVVSTTAYAERVGVVVTGEATAQPQLAAHLERWLHDHGRDPIRPGPPVESARSMDVVRDDTDVDRHARHVFMIVGAGDLWDGCEPSTKSRVRAVNRRS